MFISSPTLSWRINNSTWNSNLNLNWEFQPKFGIPLGIPSWMGINLGECRGTNGKKTMAFIKWFKCILQQLIVCELRQVAHHCTTAQCATIKYYKATLNKCHVFCQKKSKRYKGARKKNRKWKKTQTFTNKNMRSNTLLQSNSHLRHVMLNKCMLVSACMSITLITFNFKDFEWPNMAGVRRPHIFFLYRNTLVNNIFVNNILVNVWWKSKVLLLNALQVHPSSIWKVIRISLH